MKKDPQQPGYTKSQMVQAIDELFERMGKIEEKLKWIAEYPIITNPKK